MKIGEFYKLKDPSIVTKPLIWEVVSYDPTSDVLTIQHDFGNGMLSWRAISSVDLLNSYVKVDKNGNEEDQLDWFGLGMDNLPVGDQDNLKQYQCYHDFKEYVGLRESYKFCTKCDLKKGLDD